MINGSTITISIVLRCRKNALGKMSRENLRMDTRWWNSTKEAYRNVTNERTWDKNGRKLKSDEIQNGRKNNWEIFHSLLLVSSEILNISNKIREFQ